MTILAWGRGTMPTIFVAPKPVTDDELREILAVDPSPVAVYAADWTVRVEVVASDATRAILETMIGAGEIDGYLEIGRARVIPFLPRAGLARVEAACRKYGFTAADLPASLRPFIKLD